MSQYYGIEQTYFGNNPKPAVTSVHVFDDPVARDAWVDKPIKHPKKKAIEEVCPPKRMREFGYFSSDEAARDYASGLNGLVIHRQLQI